MEWIKIDINNLPEGEVLGGNFKKFNFGYKEKVVGYMHLEDEDNVICESDETRLENCTHYIDIHKFDVEEVD